MKQKNQQKFMLELINSASFMNKSLSLTFEKDGVVWMRFPIEVQSKLVKSFQKFVLNPENAMEHVILKLFNKADLRSVFLNKEDFLMEEKMSPKTIALRFEFNLEESLNNIRLIANSALKNKKIRKSEIEEGFLKTSLTAKEVNNIQQIFKSNADGILKRNSKGNIQVNYIKAFTVLWYDFLRSKNPSTIFKKNYLRQKRLGISLSHKTKKTIKVSTIIVLIAGLIFLGVFLPKSFQTLIEKYDLITLDYQMYESDYAKNFDPLSPLIDEVIVLNVMPITEDKFSGLILGLYNNLIGKKIFYESDYIWLKKCVDQNRDGIDDFTWKPALTYGNSSDQYFNMCLMIKFKILSIQKNSK